MSDPLSTFWRAQESAAQFPETKEISMKLTSLERRVRIRNGIEYAAGALALLMFGGSFIGAVSKGLTAFAIAFGLGVAGILFVLWNLHSRASALPSRPENDCRGHLRAQLVRQRDALSSVPKWYVAPLVPGVLGVHLAAAWGAVDAVGLAAVLEKLALPVGGTLLFFGFVCWLNLHAARKLGAQIAELDAA